MRQYERDPGSVYPTGPYHKATLEYGEVVVLEVPFDERNNPSFTGCLNTDA